MLSASTIDLVSTQSDFHSISVQDSYSEHSEDTDAYQVWRNQEYSIESQSEFLNTQLVSSGDIHIQDPQANDLINLDHVFDTTGYRGTGYTVAVLDTGVDFNHANLGGGWGKRVIAGYDFHNNDNNPMDDHGHGTHVAGIIGSDHATYGGVAPEVNIVALKVLGSNGRGTMGNLEDALQWVVENRETYNIVAVNMSLGGGNHTTNPHTFLDDELAALVDAGVFIASASGSQYYDYNGEFGRTSPAVSEYAVSVGAVFDADVGEASWRSGSIDYTTAPDRFASFTQRSDQLDLLAPGAVIASTYLNGGFATAGGTSMAAPMVAGAAALLHQAAIDAGLSEYANQNSILELLQDTGVSVTDGDDENDNVVNTGLTFQRIDLGAAMDALLENTPEIVTIDGSTATINGTVNNDTITLSLSGSVLSIIRDGETYDLNLSGIDQVYVKGRSGEDSIELTGTSSYETVTLRKHLLEFVGSNVNIDADSFETIIVNSNGGNDFIKMYDSVGVDSMTASPTSVVLSSTDYSNTANGYAKVYAYSQNGGIDSAVFTDSSGLDYYTAKTSYSRMHGSGFNNFAIGFADTTANSIAGGNDRAYIYDSTDSDIVELSLDSAKITRPGVTNTSNGFAYYYTFSQNGGNDLATFTDSIHDDTFGVKSDLVYLSGNGVISNVIGFTSITANATQGGHDKALFYDSLEDDTLILSKLNSTISRTGFVATANKFEQVNAYGGNGGNDTVVLNDSPENDVFAVELNSAYMSGAGYTNLVSGFSSVVANSTAGGTDRAYFNDTYGDDTLMMDYLSTVMYSTGQTHTANGFEIVYGNSRLGGNDKVTLTDSTGDDTYIERPTYSYMRSMGVYNYVNGYSDITVNATQGGFDRATLQDTSADETLYISPETTTLTRTGHQTQVNGFERVYSDSKRGGNDTAYITGSTGRDYLIVKPTYSYLHHSGLQSYAIGYGTVHAYATPGENDIARFYDTSGDELFTQMGSYGQFESGGITTYAHNFGSVTLYGNSGGTNVNREIIALDAALKTVGNWLYEDSSSLSINTPATAGTSLLNSAAALADLTFTDARTTATQGIFSNSIKIELVNSHTANSTLAVSVSDDGNGNKTITVTLATDAEGNLISTAAQVAALLNGNSISSSLITTSFEGNGSGIVDAGTIMKLKHGTNATYQ